MKLAAFSTALAALLFAGCIGWSGEQRQVIDSYRNLGSHVETGNWGRFMSGLTDDTESRLESLAELFTQGGAPFENDGELLLEALAVETDMLVFPEAVLSVEITGERAVLTAEDRGRPLVYLFREESGHWKLDLLQPLDEMFQDLFQGSPGPGYDQVIPSVISLGSGPCVATVKNSLQGTAIHHAFFSPSDSDSWGDDLLGASILGTGGELVLRVEHGTYDIQVYDSAGHSYTLWQVEVDLNGVLWEVTEADRDP